MGAAQTNNKNNNNNSPNSHTDDSTRGHSNESTGSHSNDSTGSHSNDSTSSHIGRATIDQSFIGGQGLNLFGQKSEDGDRKKRHDEILVGYRVPETHWQSVSELFVYESAFNLATSKCCMAIFTVAADKRVGETNVTILYNRRSQIGPKEGITYDNWPTIWSEFIKGGFLSIVCANSHSADEYCYKMHSSPKKSSESSRGFWFWHLDRSPTETDKEHDPAKKEHDPAKADPMSGIDTKHRDMGTKHRVMDTKRHDMGAAAAETHRTEGSRCMDVEVGTSAKHSGQKRRHNSTVNNDNSTVNNANSTVNNANSTVNNAPAAAAEEEEDDISAVAAAAAEDHMRRHNSTLADAPAAAPISAEEYDSGGRIRTRAYLRAKRQTAQATN